MSTYAAQAALVLLLGAIVVRALRGCSAALRHLAWTSALGLTLLLPLLAALPVSQLNVRWPAAWSAAAVQPGAAGEVRAPGSAATRLLALAAPAIATREARTGAAGFLAMLWLGGSLLLGARLVAGHLSLDRLRRSALAVEDSAALALLREAAQEAGCRRPLRLLESERVGAPVACGILSPVVVLPARWRSWPESRLRTVLLHEVWHIRRRDAATQLLAELVRALHWFDPLAWLAARSLARERESACDDAVLRSGVKPGEYAEAILAVAREASCDPVPAGAQAFARDLERRLRAILDSRTRRQPPSRAQAGRLVAALTAGAVVVACLGFAPDLPATEAAALDDPLSELLPDGPVPTLSDSDLEASRDFEAILRLQAAARHEKTSEFDLVGERARWALGRVDRGEVVRPLLAALSDPDWRVQAYAAWSLAVAGDHRAVPALRPLLAHPVWRVRAQAIYSLLDLQAEEAELPLPLLAQLSGDSAWQVRIGVVEHLERRDGAEARRLLAALAADPHGAVRQTALHSVSQ
ncbi:MAG TPA: M56 family metallopeptidase [Thermoanaerobaculia bacterium]|nr:M56 family metallopeptidase [Thermoanaerobaculia bacterium]